MVLTKKIVVDCKTGKETVVEFEFTPVAPVDTSGSRIDLAEVKLLVDYAKSQGWI